MPSYVLFKGQYFDPETSFTHSCFPNKGPQTLAVVIFTTTNGMDFSIETVNRDRDHDQPSH